ncbi:PIN domain-containing protein [Halobacteriovorax sp. HFRX-2_2]|uniref:PIN domain-containing protein n=1 Tax=unclassified Halobacteriovorax TaxID=2639665 RepID=UPI0037216BE1
MNKIILDTNVIINHLNSIISLSSDYKVYIPDFIITELNFISRRKKEYKSILELVEKLIDDEVFVLLKNKEIDDELLLELDLIDNNKVNTISHLDKKLLSLAKKKENKSNKMTLVTDDKILLNISKVLNIDSINFNKLKKENSDSDSVKNPSDVSKNAELLELAEVANRDVNKSIAIKIIPLILGLFGIILTSLPFLNDFIFPVLTEIINQLSTIYLKSLKMGIVGWLLNLIFALLFPFFLFYVRSKYRLYYGVFELLLGIIITTGFLHQTDGNQAKNNILILVKIISGIYFAIRGMDNIDKAILEENVPKLTTVWKNLFHS